MSIPVELCHRCGLRRVDCRCQQEDAAALKASASEPRPCTPGVDVSETCCWYDEDYEDTDPTPMPASCGLRATHYSCCYALSPCLNVCEKHRCRCKQPGRERDRKECSPDSQSTAATSPGSVSPHGSAPSSRTTSSRASTETDNACEAEAGPFPSVYNVNVPEGQWAVEVRGGGDADYKTMFASGVQGFTIAEYPGDGGEEARAACEWFAKQFRTAMRKLGAPPERAAPRPSQATQRARLCSLLESAAGMIDKHVPDLCGARGVLTSQIRDALKGKWDEGEWEGETDSSGQAEAVAGDHVAHVVEHSDWYEVMTTGERLASCWSRSIADTIVNAINVKVDQRDHDDVDCCGLCGRLFPCFTFDPAEGQSTHCNCDDSFQVTTLGTYVCPNPAHKDRPRAADGSSAAGNEEKGKAT